MAPSPSHWASSAATSMSMPAIRPPGSIRQPSVINGFSDLIVDLYGPEAGAHARSAVGMAELPFNIPVEIEGEVEIAPEG